MSFGQSPPHALMLGRVGFAEDALKACRDSVNIRVLLPYNLWTRRFANIFLERIRHTRMVIEKTSSPDARPGNLMAY